MEIFDPKIGITQNPKEAGVRDVTADMEAAELYIRKLKTEVFVEDLIKDVQKLHPLTNDEVYSIIVKIDKELKPKEVVVEPITE